MALRISLVTDSGALRLASPPVGPGEPPQGVLIEGEVGAPPRRTRIELLPRDAVAEFSLRLAGGVLPLRARVDDGALLVDSEPTGKLKGKFDLRVRIDDLTVAGNRWTTASFAGDAETRVKLTVKPRAVVLTRPLADFDPAMRALIERAPVSGPPFDGLSAADWLPDAPGAPPRDAVRAARPQAKRQAFLLNMLAVMRATPLPRGHVIDPLLDLLRVQTDHLSARAAADLYWLVDEASREKKPVPRRQVFDDFGIHASHRKALLDLARELGEPEPVTFKSYRFEGRPSMQIVFGIPQDVATSHLLDIDLDLGNPRQDLLGLIVHFGELFDEGLDHVKLREKLAKDRDVEPFLYYQPA